MCVCFFFLKSSFVCMLSFKSAACAYFSSFFMLLLLLLLFSLIRVFGACQALLASLEILFLLSFFFFQVALNEQ